MIGRKVASNILLRRSICNFSQEWAPAACLVHLGADNRHVIGNSVRGYLATKKEVDAEAKRRERGLQWVKVAGVKEKGDHQVNPVSLNKAILRVYDSKSRFLATHHSESLKARQIASSVASEYERMINDMSSSFNQVNVCTMLHRIAKILDLTAPRGWLVDDHSNLIMRLSNMLHNYILDLGGDEVGTALWAYSKFTHKVKQIGIHRHLKVEDLLKDLAARALVVMNRSNCKDVANILSAVVVLKMGNYEELSKAAVLRTKTQVENISEQSIGRIAWALGCMKHDDSDVGLLPALLKEAEGRIRAGKYARQWVATMLEGMVEMSHPVPSEFLALIESKSINGIKPVEISTIVSCLSGLNYVPSPEFLLKMCQQSCKKIREFSSQQVASTLLAFSDWGMKHERFVKFAKFHVLLIGDRQHASDILVWCSGLAQMNELDQDSLLWAIEKVSSLKSQLESVEDSEKARLYQGVLHVRYKNSEKVTIYKKEFVEGLRECWRDLERARPVSSEVQNALGVLENAGYEVELSKWVGEEDFKVASVMSKNGQRFVFEGNIPGRYFQNDSGRLKGLERWRDGVFKEFGFKTVRLNSGDLDGLESDEDKLKWLEGKMGVVGSEKEV